MLAAGALAALFGTLFKATSNSRHYLRVRLESISMQN